MASQHRPFLGALYGQGDVISPSYGAERKLCLAEARPGHLARM